MKMIILVLLIIAMVLCFLSCIIVKDADIETCNIVMLERVSDGHASYTIMYDRYTKVMYVANYQGGITPLYNADGTLRLYEP